MNGSWVVGLLFAVLGAAPGLARAQDAAAAAVDGPGPWSVGMRIGGYGFRDIEGNGASRWRDCRMNGLGVYAQHDLTEHLFLETGADFYFATGEGAQMMDRRSGLLSVAGGVRMFPGAVVSPYVQLGGGAEVTRVNFQDHGSTTRGLPFAFVGLGLDLHLGDRFRLGANLRAHLMGHFPHGHDGAAHEAGSGMPDPEMETAAQGQFYVRYRI